MVVTITNSVLNTILHSSQGIQMYLNQTYVYIVKSIERQAHYIIPVLPYSVSEHNWDSL